jgi:hypothetical protein
MSHRTESQSRILELALDDTSILPSITTNPPGHPSQPILPTGEVIDSKNTLQSFETTHPSGTPLPPSPIVPIAEDTYVPPNQPTIRTGEVIDGKNTMRSFGTAGYTPPPSAHHHAVVLLPPDTATSVSTVVAEAVASPSSEEPNIVYAELAPPPEPRNPYHDAGLPWYKRRSTYVFLAAVALLAVVGLVVFIVVAEPQNSSTSSVGGPVNAPTLASKSPTAAPIAATRPTPLGTPTAEQTTIRTNVLTDIVNNISLSNQEIVVNDISPESRALSWLIYNDTTLDTTTWTKDTTASQVVSSTTIGFLIRQRYPLLVMWFQQTSTEQWSNTNGWLVQPSECLWYGILCDVRVDPGSGDSVNAVTQIVLNGTSSYVGEIPSEIGLLSYLQHLEIRDTYDNDTSVIHIQGTLPGTLGLLTLLTYFSMNENVGLSGPLPNSLGQWTLLNYFNVYRNNVTGTIPESVGQWTALTYFDVDSNSMTGTLPSIIGKWTLLTDFDVSKNSFTGTIPTTIDQLPAISHFHADTNRLTGTLPESIGQWTALTFFSVAMNQFTGTIPQSIGNWSMIEAAYFFNNSFDGTLTTSICPFIDQDYLIVDCEINCTGACCTKFDAC